MRTFSYGNIGRSHHTGLEMEVEADWRSRVRPAFTYALSRVVDTSSGLQLKNVPRHRVTVSADVGLPFGARAFARYHRSWRGFLDDDHAFAIDGPSSIDLRVTRRARRLTVFFDALNATGDEYEEFGFTLADFTGRTIPYVYPGAPRAFRAGITVGF